MILIKAVAATLLIEAFALPTQLNLLQKLIQFLLFNGQFCFYKFP